MFVHKNCVFCLKMNKLILRDTNGVDYEVKDPNKFSNHIFNVHGEGSSIHEEGGHYFVVDDDLREKIRTFFSQN